MSYKQILRNFIIKKDTFIETVTHVDTINKLDLKEVENWTEDECKEIIENLSHDYNKQNNPWCIKKSLQKYPCTECGYGIRHGICTDAGSDYSKVILSLHDAVIINTVPGIKELLSKTKWKLFLRKLKIWKGKDEKTKTK